MDKRTIRNESEENSYMNEKYTQAYILELLEKAKKADFEFKVFGADKHRYKLNPTVSMGEVLKWEEDFNIKLPDDYVYFLTQIGNGGAGPYYGLYSLDELRQQQYYKRQDNKQNPIIDASLSKEKWNELMEQLDSADDDMYEEIEQYINTGVVIIGTQGCTYDNLLMCNGSETGKIVYIDWNLEGEYPPFLTRMSFFEWYIGFFEDIIAEYSVCSYGYNKRGTQQDLQQDYSKSYRLEDKLINLQGFLRFDTLAVETLDFLYNIHDVEVDSARLAILLKFKADLGMNLFDKFIEGENISAAISNIRRIPKEIQQKYYKKAIEILYEDNDCDKKTLLFYISDQECRRALDIIEFAKTTAADNELQSIAIYVLGKCVDAMDYEECFIAWMKGENYRIAHTALQAAISTNHRSFALMETFRWMEEKYKTDSVMRSNLKKVL